MSSPEQNELFASINDFLKNPGSYIPDNDQPIPEEDKYQSETPVVDSLGQLQFAFWEAAAKFNLVLAPKLKPPVAMLTLRPKVDQIDRADWHKFVHTLFKSAYQSIPHNKPAIHAELAEGKNSSVYDLSDYFEGSIYQDELKNSKLDRVEYFPRFRDLSTGLYAENIRPSYSYGFLINKEGKAEFEYIKMLYSRAQNLAPTFLELIIARHKDLNQNIELHAQSLTKRIKTACKTYPAQ